MLDFMKFVVGFKIKIIKTMKNASQMFAYDILQTETINWKPKYHLTMENSWVPQHRLLETIC